MSDISKIQVGSILYDIKDAVAREASVATVTELNAESDDIHVPTAKAVYNYVQNNISTGSATGEDSLARKMLGMNKLTINCFNAYDYTNVTSLNSLSPWFENFYKKSDTYIYTPNGNSGSSNGNSLNYEAFGLYLGYPSESGNGTSYSYKGLIGQTYTTQNGISYYGYSNNGILLAIYLANDKTVTIDNVNYTYPSGLYVYNNITEQSFIYQVDAYYSNSDTVKTALSRLDSRLTTIENESNNVSTSNSSPIDPSEYYTVQTMHVVSDNLNPDDMIAIGMYKISNYTQHDEIYKITDLNTFKSTYLSSRNMSGLFGLEVNNSNLEVYVLQNDTLMIYIFKTDTSLEIPVYDDNNELISTQSINISAGFYMGVEDETFAYTIQHMRKKKDYLIQKRYPIIYDENALMGVYHKVSDNTNYSGLYSAETICQDATLGMDFQYDCGGYFEPIGNNYPDFAGFPAYALNSNPFIHVEGQAPAAIIVPDSLIIPAGTFGNEEDLNVTAGTYLPLMNDIYGTFELVKLQEKETILDIDTLFGNISDDGTIIETLITQLSTSTTGNTTLTVTQDQLLEEISISELYNIFLAAFQQKGSIYVRAGGKVGTYTTVDMINLADLWQVKESNAMCAGITTTTMNNGIWMSCNLQIYSSPTHFNIYGRAAILN